MLFKSSFHPGLRDGSIDRTYRRWATPKAKVGGTYHFAREDALRVREISRVELRSVSDDDAQRAGFESLEALRLALEHPKQAPLTPSTELVRVDFEYRRVPARAPRESFTPGEVDQLVSKIETMESRSRTGPWVWATLTLIGSHPQTRAGDLAPRLGAEIRPFKARVRKLKGMDLTRSFEVGYELTPLGLAVLRANSPT